MKYCTYCGAALADDAQFCMKCGKPYLNFSSASLIPAEEPDYSEYWGKRYYDTYGGRTAILTPNGLRIHKEAPLKRFCYDKLIPYLDIVDLVIVKPRALEPGYISVITPLGGILEKNESTQPLNDPNTICFDKSQAHLIQPFYETLKMIVEDPPLTKSDDHTLETEVIPMHSIKDQYPPIVWNLFILIAVLLPIAVLCLFI